MKSKSAKIDSFNFSTKSIEELFMNEDYSIVTAKSVGTFEPSLWLETFNKSLTRNIVDARIVHTNMGLALPLKRFAVNPDRQTIEFAGLHGYNEKSKLLTSLLNELKPKIQNSIVTRIDVAIDFEGKVPSNVLKSIAKSRTPFKYINTTYSKTAKEKKTNPFINICVYPKHIKNNSLEHEVERLEFCFKGAYFGGKFTVADVAIAVKKMTKSIKKFTGLQVEISA